MLNPWPHQLRAVSQTCDAIDDGHRRICLQSPTGGGKSLIMQLIAAKFLGMGKNAVLYTNRNALTDQSSDSLLEFGIRHGVRAAGYDDQHEHAFQVASIQTEHSRRKRGQQLHKADLVLVDEAHIQTGDSVTNILDDHAAEGAVIIGFTATPLGIGHIYKHLIQAGTMAELRACGALVPAIHWGADEPDIRAFKRLQKEGKSLWGTGDGEGQDLSAKQQKLAIMTPTIFGRVWEWYNKLNTERKPCILFGPGVEESLWFAERFWEKGIPAAHIDGEDLWINGQLVATGTESRATLRAMSKSGEVKVVCNRYVLREGIDWPWIEHIILAFVAGSLQTCLQIIGRGLRAYPGKTHLTIQDHGGAWWRHGSVNADREWSLEMTDQVAFSLRAERIRNKRLSVPFCCPQCHRTWSVGTVCQEEYGGCGYVLPKGEKRSRSVVSTDGSLKDLSGEVFLPRRISQDPRGPKIWERMYWRSRTEKGSRTFAAAMALFAQENNYGWPDPSWPYMPVDEIDRFRLVIDVPMDRLANVPTRAPKQTSPSLFS